jgi:hypothetical protein
MQKGIRLEVNGLLTQTTSHKNIIVPLLTHLRGKLVKQVAAECQEDLPMKHEDPFIRFLHLTLRGSKVSGLINGCSHYAEYSGCAFQH